MGNGIDEETPLTTDVDQHIEDKDHYDDTIRHADVSTITVTIGKIGVNGRCYQYKYLKSQMIISF